ncbi:zinc ribbon domain-containing protein [Patescibacteria group bacterium]
MFCSKCGKEIAGGSQFCDGCGVDLSAPIAGEPPKEKTKKATIKKCGKCAEVIQADAKICPHCRKRQKPAGSMGCCGALFILLAVGFIGTCILNVADPNRNTRSSQPSASRPVVAPASENTKLRAGIEESSFCSKYSCRHDRDWKLKTGERNYSYDLGDTGAILEFQAEDGEITGVDLLLPVGPDISDEDREIMVNFLALRLGTLPHDTLASHVDEALKLGDTEITIAAGDNEYLFDCSYTEFVGIVNLSVKNR